MYFIEFYGTQMKNPADAELGGAKIANIVETAKLSYLLPRSCVSTDHYSAYASRVFCLNCDFFDLDDGCDLDCDT